MLTKHKPLRLLHGLALSVISTLTPAAENTSDWSHFQTPTIASMGQSIGSYTNGCISGAMSLPVSGPGYQVMRTSRNRYYGHPALIRFIQRLGQAAVAEDTGSLLIGDLGQPRGGPTPSGHRSHQTGLDVDIWFLLLDPLDNRILSENEREAWIAPSMLDTRSDGVDLRHWTPKHEKILQIAALQPEVDRIFVNASIKRELCKRRSTSSDAWLRKIRPWWKHDDHFHVRLKCPDQDRHCLSQEPLPAGDGCDASLEWWFSKEAKIPSPIKPSKPPALPALCEQVRRQ